MFTVPTGKPKAKKENAEATVLDTSNVSEKGYTIATMSGVVICEVSFIDISGKK